MDPLSLQSELARVGRDCQRLLQRLGALIGKSGSAHADRPTIRLATALEHLTSAAEEFRTGLRRQVAPSSAGASSRDEKAAGVRLSDAFRTAVAMVNGARGAEASSLAAPEPGQPRDRVLFPRRTFTFSEVLQFLAFNMKSGTLRVRTRSEFASIEISDGVVVRARSDGTPRGERLGEILVASELISEEALERLLEENAGRGMALGRILVEGSILSLEDLIGALREQAIGLFRRLIAEADVVMDFTPGERSEKDDDLQLCVANALLEGTSLTEGAACPIRPR